MATPSEISNYILSIYEAQTILMDRLVLKERLGNTNLFRYRIKANLLNKYIRIMINYFNIPTSYNTNNFFTTSEVQDIILRINVICGTNYNLDL